MNYSIVNHFDHGRKQVEIACLTDFTSAREMAKRCFKNQLIALDNSYGYIEVVEVPEGKTFAQGKAILRFNPEDPDHYTDLRLF